MTLAVLAGNSNTRLVWFSGNRAVRTRVLGTAGLTDSTRLPLEDPKNLRAVALASVVPRATGLLMRAVSQQTGVTPFVLRPGSRTGMRIDYSSGELGQDRVCAAVGARVKYPGENVIVLDIGTAITVNVVAATGDYLGGLILPGRQAMHDCLRSSTAQLPRAGVEWRSRVMQHNTRGAIRSGTANLLLGGIRHIIARVETEVGKQFICVATGGGAAALARRIPEIGACHPNLAARGLLELMRMNSPDD